MEEGTTWYEVLKLKKYLYVIRERLDEIEPRFYTKFINIYLVIGEGKALLIDTGTGLFPLSPLVKELIGDKKLIVVNSHTHFDHRGGNEEFNEIRVHSLEAKQLTKQFDVSFLRDSQQKIVKNYAKKNFILKPAPSIKSIEEGYEFDLGGISLEVIHTPGHSPGSISLLSNKNELFTGDTAYYGTMYLPKRKKFPIILSSLYKMLEICIKNGVSELFPSHETFPVGTELLKSLITRISNIEMIWNSKIRDEFLDAWILDDGKFKYVIE